MDLFAADILYVCDLFVAASSNRKSEHGHSLVVSTTTNSQDVHSPLRLPNLSSNCNHVYSYHFSTWEEGPNYQAEIKGERLLLSSLEI